MRYSVFMLVDFLCFLVMFCALEVFSGTFEFEHLWVWVALHSFQAIMKKLWDLATLSST